MKINNSHSWYFLLSLQGNPILGVHIYLYSDDISEVDCPQGSGNAPGQRKALCHAVSGADGMFTFKSIPCGNTNILVYVSFAFVWQKVAVLGALADLVWAF